MVQIYGTLGPACGSEEVLMEMFQAGMTGVRLNLSHVGLEEAAEQVERLHAAAGRCGVRPQLLLDMQGPELRVGRLAAPLPLEEGHTVRLGEELPLPEAVLARLEEGQELLLDDGRLLLRVTKRLSSGGALGQVLRGGILQSRKSAALPGLDVQIGRAHV